MIILSHLKKSIFSQRSGLEWQHITVICRQMVTLILPSLLSPGFTLLHLIATGVSCFLGAGLLSFLVYVYCQRFHKPSQESAVIHPTTPNHLNYKGNTTPKNEKYTPMEFKVSADTLVTFFLFCSCFMLLFYVAALNLTYIRCMQWPLGPIARNYLWFYWVIGN